MGCIHIYIYKYHTNINDDSLLIKQPQRRMNIALKNIIKIKLQNILCAHFIYPISYGEWVPHFVIVPKKGWKWRICVDYGELNKATKKGHSPLPFIDQVLVRLTYLGRNTSLLYGFSGYIQVQDTFKFIQSRRTR